MTTCSFSYQIMNVQVMAMMRGRRHLLTRFPVDCLITAVKIKRIAKDEDHHELSSEVQKCVEIKITINIHRPISLWE